MHKTPDISRIELDGEYDLSQREAITSLFEALPVDRPVSIDLTRVTYADSTFLNALAVLRNRLKGQTITLVGAKDNVMRVFRMVGFDQLFQLADA
jgi:anti-anti-sigma factor